MKILFINPPNTPLTSKALLIEPIDILSLATYVRGLGHAVDFLDMDARGLSPKSLPPLVRTKGYDAAVFVFDHHIPLYTDAALQNVLQSAEAIKPFGMNIVVGGKTATFQPERLLYSGTPVDIAAGYELEPVLRDLFSLPEWNDGNLKTVAGISHWSDQGLVAATDRAQRFDLAELPIPDRSMVDMRDYIDIRTMLSSRGCPHRCKFCHVPGYWGGWRGRSAASVVDEIDYLARDVGAKKILFLDDNTPVDQRRMIAISEEIVRRGIRTTLGCLSSISVFNEQSFRAMHRAGFRWIHFGIESGDKDTLRGINKNINPDQIRRAVQSTREIGMRVRTSWILDLPESTSQVLDRTIDLILETQTEEVRLHYLALRLGSEYHQAYRGRVVRAPQYIHQPAPQLSFSSVERGELEKKADYLTGALEDSGYLIVRHPDDFLGLEELHAGKTPPKIASLCPMRYGMFWRP